jgi:hypothetical protein
MASRLTGASKERQHVSSTPNPNLITVYEAKLAELIATRDAYRAQHDDHRVRLLNRQIRSQRNWIKRARALEVTQARR